MKTSVALLLLLVALTGCSGSPSSSPPPTTLAAVGTWTGTMVSESVSSADVCAQSIYAPLGASQAVQVEVTRVGTSGTSLEGSFFPVGSPDLRRHFVGTETGDNVSATLDHASCFGWDCMPEIVQVCDVGSTLNGTVTGNTWSPTILLNQTLMRPAGASIGSVLALRLTLQRQ